MSNPLAKARRVVVKVGSALLVNGRTGTLKSSWLASLVDDLADAFVTVWQPLPFFGISQFYARFEQTSDEEVQDLLAMAWRHQDDRRLEQQPNREDRT